MRLSLKELFGFVALFSLGLAGLVSGPPIAWVPLGILSCIFLAMVIIESGCLMGVFETVKDGFRRFISDPYVCFTNLLADLTSRIDLFSANRLGSAMRNTQNSVHLRTSCIL